MLTLDEANRVVAAALSYAREHRYRVSVSVCDTFGYPIAHQRMDGALPLSAHYSIAKAITSAGFGIPSELEPTAELRTLPIASAVGAGMPLTRLGGGVPLIRGGKVVGAIGVGGGPSREVEEDCAHHAVEAAGFSATRRQA
jgi:glc operon protein GlcG